jgi:hypothetical protein
VHPAARTNTTQRTHADATTSVLFIPDNFPGVYFMFLFFRYKAEFRHRESRLKRENLCQVIAMTAHFRSELRGFSGNFQLFSDNKSEPGLQKKHE